jgi:hypothetical protein
LKTLFGSAELVIIATKVDKERLVNCLKPDQVVIDLVNLKPANAPAVAGLYQGICW